MKLGAVFPQTEIGNDPGAILEYAQAAENMGYNHIMAFDHVLGANAGSRPGWSGGYRHTDAFHEPFVLFGFLSGHTTTIELVTAVIILPQRQTTLVAKQAAAVDVLSGGRLRLGIGVGWNPVEYEALGEDFHNRGLRSEEQIDLMRKLWTNELVTYDGRWHKITDAGLNPLIPWSSSRIPELVWFGGAAWGAPRHRDVARSAQGGGLRRLRRGGGGGAGSRCFSPTNEARSLGDLIDSMKRHSVCSPVAEAAGRDPGSIGIESWVSMGSLSESEWRERVTT